MYDDAELLLSNEENVFFFPNQYPMTQQTFFPDIYSFHCLELRDGINIG